MKIQEKLFDPDYTPKQMFIMGVFGNSYWRPIYSSVVNKNLSERWKLYKCLKGIPVDLMNSPVCLIDANYYKVRSGTSLEYWESKGWMHPLNPYGFVDWYCSWCDGNRGEDDNRQIARWQAIKSRFGKRKVMTPVIKQLLLQWAIKVSES